MSFDGLDPSYVILLRVDTGARVTISIYSKGDRHVTECDWLDEPSEADRQAARSTIKRFFELMFLGSAEIIEEWSGRSHSPQEIDSKKTDFLSPELRN